ncbi:MAG TPA: three-Cys-motif partner protein TcmP [Tepidisphaeraceae bacterium]|jgi:three-Cys-motif partner protein
MFKLPEPQDDGLFTPVVGSWSAHKHHFLRRYIDAFVTAMRGKKWSGLHYIDLFASAGIEQIENGPLDWGSPLIAAQAPHPFSRLHCCELSKRSFKALSERMARYPQPQTPQMLQGDANLKVGEIVKAIPTGSLSLAFLDPHGLHLHFETVKRLASHNVDLIIFFPDHLDALRNWEIYEENPNSNLDRVLGAPWRDEIKDAPAERRAEVLSEIYIKQLRTLGYSEFEFERISLPTGRFLYKLIFCSRASAGGKIWRGISNKKADGQSTFDFGS